MSILTVVLFNNARNDIDSIVFTETDSQTDHRQGVDVQPHVPVGHQRHAKSIRQQDDADEEKSGDYRAKSDGAKNQLGQEHQTESELIRAGDDFVGCRQHSRITAG